MQNYTRGVRMVARGSPITNVDPLSVEIGTIDRPGIGKN